MSTTETKIEVRDLRQSDWVWIEKTILFSEYVSAADYKVYSGLASYADNREQNAWPSIPTLCERLHLSRATVLRSLDNLKDLGIISSEKRAGMSNIYCLLKVEELKPTRKTKATSPHQAFVKFFYDTANKTRGFQPKFNIRDGSQLKRVLALNILSPIELEQLAVYFLASYRYKQFTPSIATFLSGGIMNGLINSIRNNPNFWKELDDLGRQFLNTTSEPQQVDFVAKLEALKNKLSINTAPAKQPALIGK